MTFFEHFIAQVKEFLPIISIGFSVGIAYVSLCILIYYAFGLIAMAIICPILLFLSMIVYFSYTNWKKEQQEILDNNVNSETK